MLKLNHGRAHRLVGMVLASVIAMGAVATAGAAQDKAKDETKVFEKRIVIHKGGEKDVVKHGEPGELREISTNCPGEKFEADAASGSTDRKEKVKFILCTANGEKLLAALEKAEAEIQKRDDMPADRKAEILTKIRSKIDELRAKG